jgi:hypothetical protein
LNKHLINDRLVYPSRRRKDALRQKACCRRWRHLQSDGGNEWVKTHSRRRSVERGGGERERKKIVKDYCTVYFFLQQPFFFLYFIIAPTRNTFFLFVALSFSCSEQRLLCQKCEEKRLVDMSDMNRRKKKKPKGKKDREQATPRFIFMPMFLF